ncbi:MAG: type II toxin-antitoxin system RelE/ParE family toxin [Sulfuricurvum sp.]
MKVSDFIVLKSDSYQKSKKDLLKRFRQLDDDVKYFLLSVKNENDLGISLGQGFYKARIANSDKNKGKSAGYRLITLLKVVDTKIYLVYIYDKSDLENISEQELDKIIVEMI